MSITVFDPIEHYGETLAARFDPLSRLVFVGGVPLSRAMLENGLEHAWIEEVEFFGRINTKGERQEGVGLHKETGMLVHALGEIDCCDGFHCECSPETRAQAEADRKAFYALPLVLLVE